MNNEQNRNPVEQSELQTQHVTPAFIPQTQPYPQGYAAADYSMQPSQPSEPYIPTMKDKRYFFRKEAGRQGAFLFFNLALNTLVVVVCMLVSYLIAALTNGDGMLAFDMSSASFRITLISAVFGALAGNTIPFIIYNHNRGIKVSFFKSSPVSAKFLLGCVVVCLGLNYAWGHIYLGLSSLFPSLEGSSFALEMPLNSPVDMVFYIILVCIIAPITEEFMFRGALLTGMSRFGVRFAIISTGIMFGLFHGNIQQSPFAALLGILLGYVAVKTGSIKNSILIHFINNSFATLMSYLSLKYPDSQILYYGDLVFGIVVIIASVAILIACRKSIGFPKDAPEAKENTVKHRYFGYFTALWNILIFIYLIGNAILMLNMDNFTELLSSVGGK